MTLNKAVIFENEIFVISYHDSIFSIFFVKLLQKSRTFYQLSSWCNDQKLVFLTLSLSYFCDKTKNVTKIHIILENLVYIKRDSFCFITFFQNF